jgi:hypothetical protein
MNANDETDYAEIHANRSEMEAEGLAEMREEALGFEQTATGYRATDAQDEWWKARDTCPACGTAVSPALVRAGLKYYSHDCDGTVTWWSAYSPADTADLV